MAKIEARILIVDDDPDIVESARVVLRRHFTAIHTESNPQQINFLLNQYSFDVVLLDMNFTTGVTKGSEGLFWLRQVVEQHPAASVIMITAYGDLKLAVEAMKAGAVDFIVKPWQNEKLIATVTAAIQLSQSRKELQKLKAHQSRLSEVYNSTGPAIIAKAEKMKQIQHVISRVAATDASVLILGENGTGKELIAKLIHEQSLRKNGPFVKVDVGAVAETLFESEIFGHKKGAFTDAQSDRVGRFELASGGTLFLDEIGNLSPGLQSKLLTALQSRMITPVGSNKEIPIDFRLISATNQPVIQNATNGKFREDLLYRLNTVVIDLPPLRERQEDIPNLLDHFIEMYSRKYGKQISYEPRVVSELKKYKWPGNIREFQHSVERAIILCEKEKLQTTDFLLPDYSEGKSANIEGKLSDVERKAIAEAIKKYRGNLSQAAKSLGLGRTTLYRKIGKYGL